MPNPTVKLKNNVFEMKQLKKSIHLTPEEHRHTDIFQEGIHVLKISIVFVNLLTIVNEGDVFI